MRKLVVIQIKAYRKKNYVMYLKSEKVAVKFSFEKLSYLLKNQYTQYQIQLDDENDMTMVITLNTS